MSALLDLAEQCEKATGPDAELDADICVAALGYVEVLSDEGDWRSFTGPKGRVNVLRGGEVASPELPRLTTSLDAAMTLVPDNCLAMVKQLWDGESKATLARVSRYGKLMWTGDWSGLSALPATALCAAILRYLASCDTQPKAGDVQQAPLGSGAVGEAETPKA